jgi:hypothetical protein
LLTSGKNPSTASWQTTERHCQVGSVLFLTNNREALPIPFEVFDNSRVCYAVSMRRGPSALLPIFSTIVQQRLFKFSHFRTTLFFSLSHLPPTSIVPVPLK